jgi:hypothetical protein
MIESVFILAFGIDDLLVISEAGRADKHETILLDEGAWSIFPYFVSSWFFGFCLTSFIHGK